MPADPGLGANRRYLTPDDVGRYVRGCWWRRRDATWHCTVWLGPVVATVHLPDEYRMEIVGVPSHVAVRGTTSRGDSAHGATPAVTWWRRPANDPRRAPTQVAANANPYTPAAAGHSARLPRRRRRPRLHPVARARPARTAFPGRRAVPRPQPRLSHHDLRRR